MDSFECFSGDGAFLSNFHFVQEISSVSLETELLGVLFFSRISVSSFKKMMQALCFPKNFEIKQYYKCIDVAGREEGDEDELPPLVEVKGDDEEFDLLQEEKGDEDELALLLEEKGDDEELDVAGREEEKLVGQSRRLFV